MTTTSSTSSFKNAPFTPFVSGLGVTHHAAVRMQQRAITKMGIHWAVAYGKCVQKQGLCFFILTRKSLPAKLPPKLQKQLLGLVVIAKTKWHGGWIVQTCYRNAGALKSIRKKQKYLAMAN